MKFYKVWLLILAILSSVSLVLSLLTKHLLTCEPDIAIYIQIVLAITAICSFREWSKLK